MMEKIRVAVIFGGTSSEHAISCRSAATIFENIDYDKYEVYPFGIKKDGTFCFYGDENLAEIKDGTWHTSDKCFKATTSLTKGDNEFLVFGEFGIHPLFVDVVFPVLHGKEGEDGTIQGIFEINGIPYVGCDVLSSACSMDKSITKHIVNSLGIKQARYTLLYKGDTMENVNFPVFVKPANSGSSVGVNCARNIEELEKAIEIAFEEDSKVLVEERIKGKEVEVAVIGNDDIYATIAGEILADSEFYSFESKYVSNTSDVAIPANISDTAMEKVRIYAKQIYKALGCSGLSRVDFFVDGEDVTFNEINTLPGFTSISMYPKLFEYEGTKISDLIDRLINLAIDKKGK